MLSKLSKLFTQPYFIFWPFFYHMFPRAHFYPVGQIGKINLIRPPVKSGLTPLTSIAHTPHVLSVATHGVGGLNYLGSIPISVERSYFSYSTFHGSELEKGSFGHNRARFLNKTNYDY